MAATRWPENGPSWNARKAFFPREKIRRTFLASSKCFVSFGASSQHHAASSMASECHRGRRPTLQRASPPLLLPPFRTIRPVATPPVAWRPSLEEAAVATCVPSAPLPSHPDDFSRCNVPSPYNVATPSFLGFVLRWGAVATSISFVGGGQSTQVWFFAIGSLRALVPRRRWRRRWTPRKR